jgi:large subunit ribosomal protein L18
MYKQVNRKEATRKRHYRLRRTLSGTPARPRLAVYRSSAHIYAQIIDDLAQKTLVSASTIDKDLKAKLTSGANITAASEVGKLIAERAVKVGITTVVFDRGGSIYHGRVEALADAAREAGLLF